MQIKSTSSPFLTVFLSVSTSLAGLALAQETVAQTDQADQPQADQADTDQADTGQAIATRPLEPGDIDVLRSTQSLDRAGSAADDEAVLGLTLKQAYRIALDNNLTLTLAALDEEIARVQAVGSWGAFDPVFDLAASYTDGEFPQSNSVITSGVTVLELLQRQLTSALTVPLETGGNIRLDFSTQTTGTNNAATANEFTDGAVGVGYTQPLLRGAWRTAATAQQREARILWLQSRENQRETLESVLLSVSDAYWDLVAALELVAVRELSVELGRTQLEQERARRTLGVGTDVDVLQAEAQVASEEEQLLLARTDAGSRSDNLKALLFRRGERGEGLWASYLEFWDLPIQPLSPLPGNEGSDQPVRWRSALERALEHRPDLAQLALEIDAAQIRLDRAESDRLPLLDFNVGYRGNTNDTDRSNAVQDAFTFDFPTINFGLTFQRPLGNRTLRNAERAARMRLISARLSYEQAENQAIAAVRIAVRDLVYQNQAVLAARKSRQFAERQLEAESVRQQEGLSTTFQVLQFQRDLAQALSNEAQSRSNLAKRRAALLRAEGRLLTQVELEPSTRHSARSGEPGGSDDSRHFADVYEAP